jgi:hypothetical protein
MGIDKICERGFSYWEKEVRREIEGEKLLEKSDEGICKVM